MVFHNLIVRIDSLGPTSIGSSGRFAAGRSRILAAADGGLSRSVGLRRRGLGDHSELLQHREHVDDAPVRGHPAAFVVLMMSMKFTSALRPVGGRPISSPWWVPVARARVTVLSSLSSQLVLTRLLRTTFTILERGR
jgi:hypothetical protein